MSSIINLRTVGWSVKSSSHLLKRFIRNGGLYCSRTLLDKSYDGDGPRPLPVRRHELHITECRRLLYTRTPTSRTVGVITPLFLQAYRHADRVALIDENGVHRYRDLMYFAELLADRIADQLGGGDDDAAGERVCVLCPNNASHVVAQLAAWICGDIVVAVSPKYPAAQLEYFFTDSQCRMVITTEDFAGKVQPVASKLGVTMLTLSEADYGGTNRSDRPGSQSTADSSVDDKQKERHSKRLNRLQQLRDANQFKNKPAFIFYTSGTTGSPKVSIFILNISDLCADRVYIVDSGVNAMLTEHSHWS